MIDAEAFALEFAATKHHPDPPAYSAKMVPEDLERWPVEAKKLGLAAPEIERRMAEERAGADQYNRLGILLDTPGSGDAPKKQWYTLAEGVALLLDDEKNPELAFHRHRKSVREAWAVTQREDRRRDHELRELERKRDIEGTLKQQFAHLPVTRAFAAAYEQSTDAAFRTMIYRMLPFLRMSESAGVSLGYLPSVDVCKALNLEYFELKNFEG